MVIKCCLNFKKSKHEILKYYTCKSSNPNNSQTNGEILQSAQSKAVADVLAAALLRLRHRQELSF